ncbi:FAD binding domain-containing protein [Streptomyces sp. NPDC101118]|uniref:FAD binding domain-containing protein n=1 Tax=Streptomyces sp. NPDC101118 TaxID=3366109 RepID=UPI0037F62B03
MILTEFDYARPATLPEALALLGSAEGARVLAGGQSLLADLRTGDAVFPDRGPRLLVDVRRLAELRGIRRTDGGGLRIGAATTLAELAADRRVRETAPALAAAARANGDPQVRNLGTVGGNLAAGGRATDLPVAALATDARVLLAGPGGRRSVPAEEFALSGPPAGSVVTAITVPAAPATAFEKTADRATRYPVCAVAVRLGPDGLRVAVTGATARPVRLRGVEDRLRGGGLDTGAVLAAFREEPPDRFVPGRGVSAEYLGHLAGVLTARALASAGAVLRG